MNPSTGTRVLVHGLGRFGGGREAVRFLARRGCRVRVADRSDGPDLQSVRHNLGEADIDWQLGREDPALLDDIDLMVANPAIPDEHPLLAAAMARGLPITQELDLFLAAYPGRVVGITGTNGKSTTSTLLHRALRHARIDSLLGGNIGHSLLADEANWRAEQVAVVEMSSFQLQRLDPTRSVHGAVFTRVTRDHLDRHGSLAAYHAAKARLATAARDFTVHCAEDDIAAAFDSAARHRLRFALCEPAPDSVGIRGGYLTIRRGADPGEILLHRSALALLGGFQLENVMAAGAAAHRLGAAPAAIGVAMATAPPLPFRLQQVATIARVRIYDNAVSTEIESTVSALQALAQLGEARVHWVGGGKSKDGDFATVAARAGPLVTSAHLFGAAAEPLAGAWTGSATVVPHTNLNQALDAAMQAARPGDAVLFSPAFASFDQFANFRARGLLFHEWLVSRRAHSTASG